ncbi:NusB antitermination factor [Desulfonispora thiosulfatigenes DSM 11270]|uniref:16S rRNA (cytosine(967)-C(5))-methyltransferase n=1 Tax=Desulfonispora thiosulfatigenes DSM 11270 TaxID=656914 RepID=A0A1W1VJA2_DESTI|nr:16S rRNA (cytosine(967)-C(5))-methyltransferase RsmB [Desulfonispora thiosulfatigenes]SMB93408.1 NusB antitermination factor [Desulfonispora thiosulfatigenes DSM 11270]
MNARDLALNVIFEVNEKLAYANIELDKALKNAKLADQRDKGLVTDLVYGTIKYKGRLDYIINQFAKPKVNKMAPMIRNIIRMGLYQIIFLDKVPISAAINESVNLGKRYGHKGTVGFINGVLRNIARNLENIKYPNKNSQPIEYLASFYSFPNWMIKGWVKDFGIDNTETLCEYFNNPSPLWIRTNSLKTNREELQERLQNENIETVKSEKVPEGLRLINNTGMTKLNTFKEGLFTVQDESSMIVSHVLNPKNKDFIIDTCSAPGGKTGHMAQLMGNEGKILALDIHEHRLELIKENCTRLGITNVDTKLVDAREISAHIHELVDGILVDAPCSGLGVLGRRPDARWKKEEKDIKELSNLQFEILQSASKLVKSKGTLIYSTCTIDSRENKEVVQRFLEYSPDFYLDDSLNEYLPYNTEEGKEGYIQFLPFAHKMDGFFIARLKRK